MSVKAIQNYTKTHQQRLKRFKVFFSYKISKKHQQQYSYIITKIFILQLSFVCLHSKRKKTEREFLAVLTKLKGEEESQKPIS